MARLVDEDFALYSGNDDQVLPMLSVGGSGVISTIGNITPKQTSQMIHHYFAGELEAAKEIQLAQIPLIQVIFSEVNPVPVKKAVGLLKGIVEVLDGAVAIVDVSGVGYRVLLSNDALTKIKVGDLAKLFTYTHVREEALELYGFLELRDLKLFEKYTCK